jgi:Barstar (barnase inhibitor)
MALKFRGLHRSSPQEVAVLLQEALPDGWRTFKLPSDIADAKSFFQAVRSTLPLDPPIESNGNWDALADSMWTGLDGLGDARILVVWPKSSVMHDRDPEGFKIACEVLQELCASLADPSATVGSTKDVLVVLA